MKKNILLALVVLFALNMISAQDAKYGFRLGINISSLNSDLSGDFEDGRVGVAAGFLAEFPINNKWSLQPEIQYSAQGNQNDQLRTDYINLPILLKYNFTDIVNVFAGPQAGLKIWEWENNENYKTFDFAAVVGLGFNITENFFADVRYAYGLVNVFEDDGLFGNFDANSSNIQIGVGYKL